MILKKDDTYVYTSEKLNYDITNLISGLDWFDFSDIEQDKIDKLISFYEMVVENNKVMNLTAITDFDEFVDKHFLDSLAINKAYPEIKNCRNVIDVGTGAGFPGIVLAIFYTDTQFTLFDSLNKRINFINDVVDTLGLTNVDTVCGRAEDFGKKSSYREQFDLCVTRAVAELNVLSELTLPFVKVGGKLIAYKSSKLNDELVSAIGAISAFGGNINKIAKVDIPSYDYSNEIELVGKSTEDNSDVFRMPTKYEEKIISKQSLNNASNIFRIAYDRNLLIIDKVNRTPDKYPRKAGIPKKRPLNLVSEINADEVVKHSNDDMEIPIVKYEMDNFWPYEHLGLGYCHHCGAKLDTSRFCPKCGVSWV